MEVLVREALRLGRGTGPGLDGVKGEVELLRLGLVLGLGLGLALGPALESGRELKLGRRCGLEIGLELALEPGLALGRDPMLRRAGERGGGSRVSEGRPAEWWLVVEVREGETGALLLPYTIPLPPLPLPLPPLLLLLLLVVVVVVVLATGAASQIAPSVTRSKNSRFVVFVIATPFPIARVAFAFTPFHVAADAFPIVARRTSSCHFRCVLCQWLSFSPGAGFDSGAAGGV